MQVNTTEAINVIASGLPWREGDRVLLTRAEFPANVYPYLNLRARGVEIDWLPDNDGVVTPEMVEQALTPRTRLLALSAVQFLSGYRADLGTIGALCRSRNVVYAVDGIQAVGGVVIDVRKLHIDALAAGAQKWQMGPHGTGFLYLTESLQERIHQAHLGWISVANPWDFKDYEQPLAPSARRYEGGTLAMPGLWGMHAAISTLLEFKPEEIESHILSLTELLLDELSAISGVIPVTPREPERRAGIVTARVSTPHIPEKVFASLEQRGVLVALREGCLRFSPHFYNSAADVETAAAALRDALGNRNVAA
jgi:selenocysteine lyase/cysteine desulfurase